MKSIDEIFLSRAERVALYRVARGHTISFDMQRKLGLFGLVSLSSYHPNSDRAQCQLTASGERYLDFLIDKRNDRRWTRGLAIVALVISLFALLLELDDRGYLGGMFSALKSTQSVAQRLPD